MNNFIEFDIKIDKLETIRSCLNQFDNEVLINTTYKRINEIKKIGNQL